MEGGWWRRVEREGGGRNAGALKNIKLFTVEVEVYKPCGTA